MYYMFLADGFEETEALVTLDLMRRCNIDVCTVGINNKNIKGTHGITVITDFKDTEITENETEGIILPGGMPGTENLYNSDIVLSFLDYCMTSGKLVAAICAAPSIPGRRGYLDGRQAVCFPGFEKELSGAIIQDRLSVRDGNVITAKGAGAVFEFSYDIISYIKNESAAKKVLADIQHL